MSMASNIGSKIAAKEILALIQRLRADGASDATIVAAVEKCIQEIVSACDSGWY